MSLDGRITGKDAPPPPPPAPGARRPERIVPQQAPDRVRSALATATVQPGQTLVLALAETSVTAERLETLREEVAARLAGVNVVVVAGVAQMAVYDPAAAEQA